MLIWKKSTSYTVLKKLCDRGLFRNDGGTVTAIVSRKEFHTMQSERCAASYAPQDVVHNPAPTAELPVSGAGETITEVLLQGEEQTVADPLEAPMVIATMVWLTGVAVVAG